MNLANLQKYRTINYFGLGLSFVLALSQIYFIPYLTIGNWWLLILFLTLFFINLFYLFCFAHLINIILEYKEKNSDSYKRLNAIKDFRKKHGEKLSEKYGNERLEFILTNLDKPKAHSKEIKQFIIKLLNEDIKGCTKDRRNDSKVDGWSDAFTTLAIITLIIAVGCICYVFNFSIVQAFKEWGTLGAVLGAFTIGCFRNIGKLLYSKMSPKEKTYRAWLAKYQKSLKEENLEEN